MLDIKKLLASQTAPPEAQKATREAVPGLHQIVAAQGSATSAPQAKASLSPANDPGFQAYFKKYGKGKWDPVDEHGMSGGYNLYQAYRSGLIPDAAGHLPDHAPGGQVLKSDSDPNAITGGIDNRTGYQVAPPNYTGPMTADIIKNAPKYFRAGTAVRHGGPGNWDDIPTGKTAHAKTVPLGYTLKPTK